MIVFVINQLIGDDICYVGLCIEQIIGCLLFGLCGDMCFGLLFEVVQFGMCYSEVKFGGIFDLMVFYVGGEMFFGLVYFGFGYLMSGILNFFFFVGIF